MRVRIRAGERRGRLRGDRRGIALLVALVIMVFLSLVGTTFLVFSLTESQISTNQAEAAVALEMAEAGVDHVIFWLGNPRVYVDQVGANPGFSFHRYIRTDRSGNGSESWYTEGNGQTSYLTGTVAGQRFFDKRAWDAQKDIPSLVGKLVNGTLGTPPRQFNGTYAPGLTPGAVGSQPDLLLDGGLWSAHQGTLDSVFTDLRAATGGRVRRVVVYGSLSGNAAATVRVTGESRSGVSRTVEMELIPIGAPGLANSIGSGGTAGWNGNFRVHWGGVRSVGNVTLANPGKTASQPAAVPGVIDGDNVGGGKVGYHVGPPGGYSTWDHWFTLRTAGTIDGFATQADLKDAYGQSATIWGDNLTPTDSNVTIDTVATWDYASLKKLSQQKGWYYESGTGVNAGQIRGPKTGGLWTDFKAALANQTGFMFIDTTNGSPPAADGSNLASFTVSGGWYTGVSAYVGGNLDFSGLGSGTSVTAQTPPWDASLADPTQSEDPGMRQSRTLSVHIKGAFYSAGTVEGGGNVTTYGAFVALRGYGSSGDPEVWYDWGLRNGILSLPPVRRASNTWHEVKVN
ncbi:MAG: pilus assembly PilX N-terminal domain-containing protein [candidate division NC10 bacterium]|nr:pilus assembly PilX N-terminal domain-containing protein [candidate division NC10 bacterium]